MKKLISFLCLSALLLTSAVMTSCEVNQTPVETTTEATATEGSATEETVVTTTAGDSNDTTPENGYLKTVKLSSNISGIHVYGKRVLENRNYLNCDYSGSGIEFVVDSEGGDILLATKTEGACRFLVTLDGESISADGYVTVDGSADIVFKNLIPGKHTVRVIKLTGYEQATARFYSLKFYGKILSSEAPAEKPLLVEFLGGDAATGLGINDQDATKAYPYLLANALETEYSIMGLKDTDLLNTMKSVYTLASYKKEAETLHTFATKADATVIHVGSNGMDAEAFTAAYRALLASVRENNGVKSRIVCFYNAEDTVAATAITALCNEFGGERSLYFAYALSVKDSGALTAEEQIALKDAMLPLLKTALETEAPSNSLVVGNGDKIEIDFDYSEIGK